MVEASGFGFGRVFSFLCRVLVLSDLNIMEIKKKSTPNCEFSQTYWLDLGRTDEKERRGASDCRAQRDAAGAFDAPPGSPNRGGGKYGGFCSNSCCDKDLDYIHPSSGLDYLCFGLYGYWRAPHLLALLEEAKNNCSDCIKLAGYEFGLSSCGLRDGIYYPFVLEFHGVKILILPDASGSIAPVRVHVPGLVLLQCDWRAVVADVLDVLERLGFAYERSTVSRCDIQVTLRMAFGDLSSDMLASRRVVTDCRGDLVHYRNLTTGDATTVWYRSNTIQLCAYDKTGELHSGKAGTDYYNIWCRLFGDSPEPLSRVEFRLRSDALRRWGVTSLEDLDEMLPAVAHRLTSVWFRVLKCSKVRGHEREAALSPIWSKVRSAFLKIYDGTIKTIVPVRRHRAADPIQLIQQARGCMAAAVPFLARSPSQEDLKDAFDDVTRLIKTGLDDKIQEKCIQFFRRTT